MLEAVQGTYQAGRVDLDEIPPHIRRARVVVTFLETEEASAALPQGTRPTLPVLEVGAWPEHFTARREELYGDDGR